MEFFPNAAPKYVESFKNFHKEDFTMGLYFIELIRILLYKVEIQIQDKMVLVRNNGVLEDQDFL
jgi:hypothetical protein